MTDRAAIVGHVLLFLTTLAGFGFQWFREARQHRWQKEKFRGIEGHIKNGSSAE